MAAIRAGNCVDIFGYSEEIAYTKGWIDRATLAEAATRFAKTNYGRYLEQLMRD